MTSMKLRVAVAILFVSVTGTEASADDFDRRGWYVGVGAGVGVDFLSDFVESETGGAVVINPTGTFNARGGYRAFSWLAFEAMYEGVYGLSTDFLGTEVSRYSFHSIVFNAKLILPIWRIQPYFIVGGGPQQGSFDGRDILAALDEARWDPAFRAGVGLDVYATKSWLINFELAPSIRFRDYVIPTTSTDNVTLTFSAGVQYRF
jgi:opacity protein-like surface antigen